MKLYITDDRTIIFIQFENIKIALGKNICIFLSNIDKNINIKIHKSIREKLLKKFKVYDWNSLDYNENMLHIKFLVKYSPILSKFIDTSEFDTIELVPFSDQVVDNWNTISYIKFNDGKEFFNVYDVSYTGLDVISLKIDSEFLKILEKDYEDKYYECLGVDKYENIR